MIHELCHTKYLSHGVRFWNLVAKFVPNHRDLAKQLLKYRGEFFYAE
jgi:predicted metal-dependent hydrolase